MSAQALRCNQINAPGQEHFQVVHQFQIRIKIFAARLEGHQKINITVWVDRLITPKRAEDGAACKPHRPQRARICSQSSQNIRALGDRGNPCNGDGE